MTSSFVRTANIYADMALDFSDGRVTSSLTMFPQIISWEFLSSNLRILQH